MITLQKMTADYVDHEDRIALIGDAGDGHILRLWLIRPLARQLTIALTELLKIQSGEIDNVEAQEAFKQAAAEKKQKSMPAVKYVSSKLPLSAIADSTTSTVHINNANEWLVREIGAKLFSQGVTLSFQGVTDAQNAGCGLSEELLRQWLGILRKVCHSADWIGPDWPSWMNSPMILEDGSAAN